MKNKKQDSTDYEEFRTFPLYVILICGLIVLFAGLYFAISKTILHGTTFAGKYGQGGGNSVVLNGWGVAIIGALICVFPVLQLIKSSIRKKS